MKAELVKLEDLNGSYWRLVLETDPSTRVVLECLHGPQATDWTHVKVVTRHPKDVGCEWHKEGVSMVDAKVARPKLVELMAQHGANPRPATIEAGISSMGTLPGMGLSLEEPELYAHHRVSLFEFLLVVEAAAADATDGIWRAADGTGRSLGAILDAVVTGAPSDPVAESMSREDLMHVLTSQPLAAGALVRKLREAVYLVQDLAKAVLSMRGELDNLSHPTHRPAQLAQNLELFDRWLAGLRERCALLPVIQVPDYGHVGPLEAGDDTVVLSRDDLVRIARFEAWREGRGGKSHEYLPKSGDEAESFEPHQWVLWAMAAAAEKASAK